MRRRQVLALGAASLAGCIASPSPPEQPPSPPNVFADFEWTGDAHRVTFAYGSPVTEHNTATLVLVNETTEEEVFWVAHDRDARASFPLEPGASTTIAADREAALRVVWVAPSGDRSATLATNREGSA